MSQHGHVFQHRNHPCDLGGQITIEVTVTCLPHTQRCLFKVCTTGLSHYTGAKDFSAPLTTCASIGFLVSVYLHPPFVSQASRQTLLSFPACRRPKQYGPLCIYDRAQLSGIETEAAPLLFLLTLSLPLSLSSSVSQHFCGHRQTKSIKRIPSPGNNQDGIQVAQNWTLPLYLLAHRPWEHCSPELCSSGEDARSKLQ